MSDYIDRTSEDNVGNGDEKIMEKDVLESTNETFKTGVEMWMVYIHINNVNVHAHRVRRIIGGVPADPPPPLSNGPRNVTRPTTSPTLPKEPLVFIRRDRRSAAVNGRKNEDGTYSFLGIRYAEPPLKRFRFQRPRRLKLRGEIDATKFGRPCAQWWRGVVFGSEDCLFLNIFTPEVPTGNGKHPSNPVLLWIHGGNFQTGSAAQYYPTHLVKKGIVVVTIQYRLGSLGFLSIGRKELPGNTGLFDIATALRWVSEYIQFFGGDPRRIMTGGQGSGASCATMLALNKHTRKRVNGVVAMSGSPISPFSLDENEIRTAREVSKEAGNNCDAEEGIKFVRCMQKLPLETIMKADSGVEKKRIESNKFPKGLANLLVPGPSEEGKEDERFLPNFVVQSPMEAIKKGLFPSVPLLTGVNKEETGAACRGTFLEEIKKKLLSPNFLQSELFSGALYANNGMFVNKTVNPQLSSLFLNGDYLKFFTMLISSALSDLDKVIKHTTDAFFNLPAFLTSNFWSKKSNVFLYSFEHTPKKTLSDEFLSGIPLVSSSTSQKGDKKGPVHGDDLMYLFDVRSLEGEELESALVNNADVTVRDHFCTMVAEFVRSGKPRFNGSSIWQPFSPDKGNYMVIKEQPESATNFHKCEMGMWTGDNSILGSSDCSVLNQATQVVTNTIGAAGTKLLSSADELTETLGVNALKDQLESVSNPLEGSLGGLTDSRTGSGLNPLGGLLGTSGEERVNITTTVKPISRQTTKSNGGLLNLNGGGGLLG